MPAKPATKLTLEKLALHCQLPAHDIDGLKSALCKIIMPITLGLLRRLRKRGILKTLRSNQELRSEARSIASITAMQLLDGTCDCGAAAEASRLCRKPGSCGAEHSLNGWNHSRDRLERFLLRCLLSHTAPISKVPDDKIDTPEKLEKTAHTLSARGVRDLVRGMALRQIFPPLRLLKAPVCADCKTPVSLKNTCNCVNAGNTRLPKVRNGQPRLVSEDDNYRWQAALAWRIIPPAQPGDRCQHRANAKDGGILVIGAPDWADLQQQNTPPSDSLSDKKPPKHTAPTPPCPLCGKLLSGKPTRLSVRTSPKQSPHQTHTGCKPPEETACDLTHSDKPPAPPPPFPNPKSIPKALKSESKLLLKDLQQISERLVPGHPDALDEQTVAELIQQRLQSCSPELRQYVQQKFGGA